MFKKLQELRQQKAQAVEQMREMLANADKENRSLNEEEGGKFDALKAKVDELKTEIERLETVTEEERSNRIRDPQQYADRRQRKQEAHRLCGAVEQRQRITLGRIYRTFRPECV